MEGKPPDWKVLRGAPLEDESGSHDHADPMRAATATGIALGLAGLSVWQAGSLGHWGLFIAGLVVALVVDCAAHLLLLGLRVMPVPRAVVRQTGARQSSASERAGASA